MSQLTVDERNGGCAVIFEGKLYVWGGEGLDRRHLLDEIEEDSSSEEEEEEEENSIDPNLVIETPVTLPRPNDPKHPFDVFDMNTHTWSRQPTSGDFPSLGLGSSLVVHPESRSFYLYGGWNEGRFSSEVYRCLVDSWKWEIVQPVTDVKPSPRYLTGVVIHEDRLCMFGGVGVDIVTNQDPGAEYTAYVHGGVTHEFGWNNEYYEFSLKSYTWIAPLGRNALRPDPMGGLALSKFDQHRAVLFGGRCYRGRMNEIFIFDLNSWVFTGPLKPSGPAQSWPLGRTFATLTPLIDPERVGQRLCGCGPVLEQRVLLLWGKHTDDVICDEAWLLDSNRFTWTQLSVDMKPRSWHIACPVYDDKCTECHVVIFGGNVHIEGFFGDRVNTADLKILQFGVKSLVNCCLSVIVRSEEVMAGVSSLPPALQTQIKGAHEAYINSPPVPMISSVCASVAVH